MRRALVESWRVSEAEPAPEGVDPLLWELGQLRRVAQGAPSHAAKTRNLPGKASLLRAANGLLDLLARIEKAKAEEIKARKATETLEDRQVIEDELNLKLDQLAERMRQAEAVEREREQKMGKCLRCGQALPSRGRVDGETPVREEPKPPEPGVH